MGNSDSTSPLPTSGQSPQSTPRRGSGDPQAAPQAATPVQQPQPQEPLTSSGETPTKKPDGPRKVHIYLDGKPNSGHSSFCYWAKFNLPLPEEKRIAKTMYETYEFLLSCPEGPVNVILHDTTSMQRYRQLTEGFFCDSRDVFLVFTDVNDPKPYEEMRHLTSYLNTQRGPNTQIYIVGNKIDKERSHNYQQMKLGAMLEGVSAYYETCTLDVRGVAALISDAVRFHAFGCSPAVEELMRTTKSKSSSRKRATVPWLKQGKSA